MHLSTRNDATTDGKRVADHPRRQSLPGRMTADHLAGCHLLQPAKRSGSRLMISRRGGATAAGAVTGPPPFPPLDRHCVVATVDGDFGSRDE